MNLKKRQILAIFLIIVITVIFGAILKFNKNSKPEELTIKEVNQELDPTTYYKYLIEMTDIVYNSFKELEQAYPQKYSFLTNKLKEYNKDMQIKEEDSIQEQILKASYANAYWDEIFQLVAENNISDEEIVKDYEAISKQHRK